MQKRFAVILIGVGFKNVVGEFATKQAAEKCRAEWESTHGCDHTIKLVDRKPVKLSRKQRDSIMSELGLTKVRGALGGIYYE